MPPTEATISQSKYDINETDSIFKDSIDSTISSNQDKEVGSNYIPIVISCSALFICLFIVIFVYINYRKKKFKFELNSNVNNTGTSKWNSLLNYFNKREETLSTNALNQDKLNLNLDLKKLDHKENYELEPIVISPSPPHFKTADHQLFNTQSSKHSSNSTMSPNHHPMDSWDQYMSLLKHSEHLHFEDIKSDLPPPPANLPISELSRHRHHPSILGYYFQTTISNKVGPYHQKSNRLPKSPKHIEMNKVDLNKINLSSESLVTATSVNGLRKVSFDNHSNNTMMKVHSTNSTSEPYSLAQNMRRRASLAEVKRAF